MGGQQTADGRQQMGDRRQETGDGRQEMGDRRWEMGDRRQERWETGIRKSTCCRHLSSNITNVVYKEMLRGLTDAIDD